MNNIHSKKLAQKVLTGKKQISEFSHKQKTALEKSWDVDHAYYSSALEGSKIDRKEFEKLAEKVK